MRRSDFMTNKTLDKVLPDEKLWEALKFKVYDVREYALRRDYQEEDLYLSRGLRECFMRNIYDVSIQEVQRVSMYKSQQVGWEPPGFTGHTISYKIFGMPVVFLRSLGERDGFLTLRNKEEPLEFTINKRNRGN